MERLYVPHLVAVKITSFTITALCVCDGKTCVDILLILYYDID